MIAETISGANLPGDKPELSDQRVEARDGIEPPDKALQTLPFSFWVPRPLSQRRHSEGNEAIVTTKLSRDSPSGPFIDSLPRKNPQKKLLEKLRLRWSIRDKSRFCILHLSNL